MRRPAAAVALFPWVAVVASCATLVGVQPIPDVDGGSDVAQAGDAPVEAPEEASLVDQVGEGPRRDGATSDAAEDAPRDAMEGEGDAAASCTAPGWGCVPVIPTGWDFELVDRTDSVACAAGLTINEVVASASGAPATCTCTCGVGQEPSCTYGTLTASVGSMACGEGMANYDASGKCVTPGGVSPLFLQGSPMAPVGGSCSPSLGKSVPAMQETKWRTCGFSGTFAGGCPAGEVCAPVAAGLSSCVAASGNVQCPAAYPNGSTVGTGASDTRDCGACTCAGPTGATCSGATLTFYVDTACTNVSEAVGIDFTCHQLAGSTYNSYAYTASPSETCGPVAQQPGATGSVSITGTTTVCCAP